MNLKSLVGSRLISFTRARRKLLVIITLLTISARPGFGASIVPLDEKVEGKTYSEWVAASWKWFQEIPWDGRHPAQDRAGTEALRNQQGLVWFLTGSTTSQPITRSLSIPDNVYLYTGAAGVSCSDIEPPPYYGSNEEEMRACAESFGFAETRCWIDDVEVPNLEAYRVTSPLYDFVLPPVNVSGVAGGGAAKGVGSNIDIILRPLPVGLHTIRTLVRASEGGGGYSADITYRVTVYPRPEVSIRRLPELGQMEFSWLTVSDFFLQSSERLGSDAVWVPADVLSTTFANGASTVTVANSGTRYFRLRRT